MITRTFNIAPTRVSQSVTETGGFAILRPVWAWDLFNTDGSASAAGNNPGLTPGEDYTWHFRIFDGPPALANQPGSPFIRRRFRQAPRLHLRTPVGSGAWSQVVDGELSSDKLTVTYEFANLLGGAGQEFWLAFLTQLEVLLAGVAMEAENDRGAIVYEHPEDVGSLLRWGSVNDRRVRWQIVRPSSVGDAVYRIGTNAMLERNYLSRGWRSVGHLRNLILMDAQGGALSPSVWFLPVESGALRLGIDIRNQHARAAGALEVSLQNGTPVGSSFLLISGNADVNFRRRAKVTLPALPPRIFNSPRSAIAGALYVWQPVFDPGCSADGQPASVTWSASGLPAGLSINTSTGEITGTPAAAGTPACTITATNAAGAHALALNFTVLPPASPAVAENLRLDGTALRPVTLLVEGENMPASVTITAGALPAGVTLSGRTISGTPASAGTGSVTISATNAFGTDLAVIVWEIQPPQPVMLALPERVEFVLGRVVSYTVPVVEDGTSGAVTWAITALPAGTVANGSRISGTPTEASSGVISITATRNAVAVTGLLPYVVRAALPVPIVAGPQSVRMVVGRASQSVQMSAAGDVRWEASGLPPGISINSLTGLISGTATTAGRYTATVFASNADERSEGFRLEISVADSVVRPAFGSGAAGSYERAFVQWEPLAIAVGALNLPTAFAAAGLPPGVTIDDTGLISGVPEMAGLFVAAITASNDAGVSEPMYLTFLVEPGAGGEDGVFQDLWLDIRTRRVAAARPTRDGAGTEAASVWLKTRDVMALRVWIMSGTRPVTQEMDRVAVVVKQFADRDDERLVVGECTEQHADGYYLIPLAQDTDLGAGEFKAEIECRWAAGGQDYVASSRTFAFTVEEDLQ